MNTNSKKNDSSKGLVFFQTSIHLDGSHVAEMTQTPDEELAAQQGIIIEQLRDVRAKVLAKVYAYILSWPDPTPNTENLDETS